MINILLRFLIIYFITIFAMKLMGKRQIGELQMSELVTTFFLSELATCTIVDNRIPLLYGIIPILALLAIEVVLSFISIKIPLMKRVLDNTPSVLIQKGKISQKELRKNRMTIDELLSLLRLQGFPDINQVYFAILEPNGKISVVPYSAEEKPVRKEFAFPIKETGYTLALVEDGKVNTKALKRLGKDEKWLQNRLQKQKLGDVSHIFIYTENEAGDSFYAHKENK